MKLNTLIFLMKEILMCTHTRLIDKNIEMSTPYVLPLNEGLFFIVVEYSNTNAYHENLVLRL